jgi:hypothetical protein
MRSAPAYANLLRQPPAPGYGGQEDTEVKRGYGGQGLRNLKLKAADASQRAQ